MRCPQCNTTLDEDAIFCGNCGTQIAPMQKRDNATVPDEALTRMSIRTRPQRGRPAPGSNPPLGQQPTQEAFSQRSVPYVPQTPQMPETPSPVPSSPPLRKTRRTVFIVGLVLVLIAAATFSASLVFKSRTPATGASSSAPK